MGWFESLKSAFVSKVKADPVINAFRDSLPDKDLGSVFRVVSNHPVSPNAGRGQPILAGYDNASIIVADTKENSSFVAMVARRTGTEEYDVLSIKNAARPHDPLEAMDRIAARNVAVGAKTCVLGLSRG